MRCIPVKRYIDEIPKKLSKEKIAFRKAKKKFQQTRDVHNNCRGRGKCPNTLSFAS